MLDKEVIFVTPSPGILRVGVVWVLVQNWLEGARKRWGYARVLTPDGFVDHDDIRQAAWGRRESYVRSPYRRWGGLLLRTAAKDARNLVIAAKFDQQVRRNPPDIDPLFIWQYHSLFQKAGLTIGQNRGCPVVLFVDAPQVWESAKWGVGRPGWGRLIERYGERPQFRHADIVACVSEEVAKATIERGALPDRVVITPGTADVIRRAPERRDSDVDLGLGQEVVVGWVGSFRAFHDAEMLVSAAAKLKPARDVALVMVGEGATRSSCMGLAAQLGLRRALFPGFISHDKIAHVLRTFDIAVVPRGPDEQFHGSPTKLKEYLAAGCAVVAPRVGEIARMFRHEHDLLMYTPGDPSEMRDAIQLLIDDPRLRGRLGREGQRTYDRLFTMESQLDVLAQRLGLPGNAEQSRLQNSTP